MNAPKYTQLLIGVALFAAAAGGVALKPTERIASRQPGIDLKAMIPAQFADWKIDEQGIALLVDPQSQAASDRIYSQTLARAYVNPKGERIVLAIAYGGDQSDSMQVHKPEVCYPAQGFRVMKLEPGVFDTGFGNIPVKRMLATQGPRIEPVMYWITVGDTVAGGDLERKLAQLKYGLTGKVPDGLLFRVSSIGDEASAYPVQEGFIRALLKALAPESRQRLIGGVT